MDIKYVPKINQKQTVCVVVGTRPGIIKMSPIIRELARRNMPHFVLHAGQHYSYNMDKKFFEDLELSKPLHHLDEVKRYTTHASQTAEMMKGMEEVFFKETPAVVLVCGDANTNFSGAVAARKLGLVVGHVEAGLRSYDWRMPEEHNRVMIDHISELLFAPTEKAKANLLKENVRGRIVIAGNTIVDASLQNIDIARRKNGMLGSIGIKERGYVLFTAHREENVDNYSNLKAMIEALDMVSRAYPSLPIIFPMHPRTTKRIEQFGLKTELSKPRTLRLIEPVGYLDFLMLISSASAIMTDSGGIQEEACVLKVPCVTLRENTERPESLEVGGNVLAGVNPERILEALGRMLNKNRDWANPFGDGKAAQRITDAVCDVLEGRADIPGREYTAGTKKTGETK